MDVEAFIAELDALVASAGARISAAAARPPAGEVSIPDLLAAALRSELEASEEAAAWMAGEKDVELKLGFARQCGDEARHYRLIEARLRELGVDPGRLEQGRVPSPLYRWLRGLETPAERLAAGALAREGVALATNAAFARLCAERGDEVTARLYREEIGPDEAHHHEFGRRMLRRFAIAPDDQERARAAVARALRLAEDGLDATRARQGAPAAPGC
ncbi:MAG TPA: ferritin-like domain-containing protein [Anaeromyxobacter sp.]|nr:ferritin-like domain-containing protein [Anaeromyxobacter sp.]